MSTNDKSGAEHVQWDLTDLYRDVDDPQLAQDRKAVADKAREFADRYRGRIASLTPSGFKQALQEYEQIQDLLGRILSFSHLIWTTNTEDSTYGKLVQEANELSSQINQRLVFFELEWLELDEQQAEAIMNDAELKSYGHFLETSRMFKPYRLEEKQEQMLSAKSVTGAQSWGRYFDETFGAARIELDGEVLTEQQVLGKMHEPDRALRQRAADAMSQKLDELGRSTTFIFNILLADKYTNDTFRGYPSWIKPRNLANEIRDEAVDSLVDSVTGRYDLVRRYYHLKCRLLGLDEMYEYDRYAPLETTPVTISWDRAREIVLEAYYGFSTEMGDTARMFFDNRWIDAAIRPGKRGGAYSASTVPSVHPYVFMNYEGKIRDVQTLAHELGHGVHQYLSRDQGVLQAGTPLTTAETASVFGEMLVFQNLLKNMDSDYEVLSMLMGKIDDTIATVFRQISMNRFEDAIHRERRSQGEMDRERICELWMQTQRELYGDAVTLRDNYRLWWSYIPHFVHVPGYVYAYAFGELLVLALYQKYEQQPDGFAERYMQLLRAGGSDWPENLTAELGVDINSPDFWSQGLGMIEQLIERAEEQARNVAL